MGFTISSGYIIVEFEINVIGFSAVQRYTKNHFTNEKEILKNQSLNFEIDSKKGRVFPNHLLALATA